ncbi:MAG: hypothetical protein JWR80_1439 [Bradyrhizobium sp.]|nr:hypothetical protein [Bradyrhizobium sp.]
MRHPSGMCIVNSALVEELAPIAHSQAAVTEKLGISWNSWIKIVAGLPVRRSLGLRLEERVLALDAVKLRFAGAATPENCILLPAGDVTVIDRFGDYGPRSLRQAKSLRSNSTAGE